MNADLKYNSLKPNAAITQLLFIYYIQSYLWQQQHTVLVLPPNLCLFPAFFLSLHCLPTFWCFSLEGEYCRRFLCRNKNIKLFASCMEYFKNKTGLRANTNISLIKHESPYPYEKYKFLLKSTNLCQNKSFIPESNPFFIKKVPIYTKE